MSAWQKYYQARSLHDALDALSTSERPALPVGGGTDLLLEIQQGRHSSVHTLVDVTNIPELNRLEIIQNCLFIGAGLAIRKIVESRLVQQHALAVCEACNLIGGPQVRNTATLGGNVAHALPAADGMIALLAMDAIAEIASESGTRQVQLDTLFIGPGISALQKDKEILVGFYLPLHKPGQGSAFSRVMRPQGVALPILNMAIWIQRNGDMVNDIRIAIGPSGPVPVRATAAENAVRGKNLNNSVIDSAKDSIHTTIPFRTSAMRASAEYRHHLSEILLEDVLAKAWERAGQVEEVTK
jgi:xanthine dehydrogenase FAD-binding subunit